MPDPTTQSSHSLIMLPCVCPANPIVPDPGGGSKQPRRHKKKKSPKKLAPPIAEVPPLRLSPAQLTEAEIDACLRHYTLTPRQLQILGYPVESELHPGRAIIFHPFPPNDSVREPRCSDSSSGSSGSEEADDEALTDPSVRSEERRCVRCGRGFFLLKDKYLTTEKCVYHWGKQQRSFGYSCCNGAEGTVGCASAKLHVWNGIELGVNGPLSGYVVTQPSKKPPDGYGVYAIDCEMCYTTQGLELCKVSVVAINGKVVYNTYVKPEIPVVDYNTRFSGVTSKHLQKSSSVKTIKEVQKDLLEFVSAETVLIGHGLENDLKALKIIHGTVVDTAVAYPHHYGLPYRRSLRSLASQVLQRDIQTSSHDSVEDALAYRAILIWRSKDWTEKEHRSVRVNVDYDYASLIRWSPDSKAFLICRAASNELQAFRIVKKTDGGLSGATKGLTYPKVHSEDIIGLGIASSGKFIVSCSGKTDLVISDVKGVEQDSVDTLLMETYCAGVTPCGRYAFASGFAPDAKLWEPQFSKTGEFKQTVRAFELRGHTSGIHRVAFNADSSRVVTVSKDATWRLYNILVEWQKGEDPKFLQTGRLPAGSLATALALSPKGDVIAVAADGALHLYFADTAELDASIPDVYNGDVITQILFDAPGNYILTSGEKHVRIFHNVTGHKAAAELSRAKLMQSGLSAATKERLELQIQTAEAIISSLS